MNTSSSSDGERPVLKRSLGLPMITLYGLGTIVGGGFYALSGKVAGEAGMLAPWAFLVAAGIALFSALSFAELSARFPVSAGVKRPQRNLPIAILISVVATGLIYFVVALVTVLSTTQQELAASDSPLSLAVGDWRLGGALITAIGMLAGLNGALVQMVMSSRVAYGLASQGQAPAFLARVNRVTRTPLEATAAGTAIVLILALWLPLEAFAQVTSTILLVVYALVNLALWAIKGSQPKSPDDAPCYPRWLPLSGAVVCLMFLLFHLLTLVGTR